MTYNNDSYYRGEEKKITPGGIVALIISIGILLLIGVPVSDKGTIERFGWEYSIDLEELRDVDRSGWYLPDGATLKYTREEVKETKKEKVRVGQDANGMPKYAEVEVEVKATKYYYTIKDWCYSTTYVESGFGREGMKFSEVNIKEGQRLANPKQIYEIYIRLGDELKTLETNYDEWMEAEIGGRVKYKHFRFFGYKIWGIEPV